MNLTFDSVEELDTFLRWSGKYRRIGDEAIARTVNIANRERLDTEGPVIVTGGVSGGQAVCADELPDRPASVVGSGEKIAEPNGGKTAEGDPTPEPTKRKRRTKAEIEADEKRIADLKLANEAADANRAENFDEAREAYESAGEAALEAARDVLRDKAGPQGANPFEATTVTVTNVAPDAHDVTSMTDPDPAALTPFQHITLAREFIGKHGMPKYNETFVLANLGPDVMVYSLADRVKHAAVMAMLNAG